MTTPRRLRQVAAAAILATLLSGCDRHTQDDPPPPAIRPVLTTVVTPTTADVFGPFTGTVEPRYQSTLGFRAAGRIVTRDRNVGDQVVAGDRLASLDQTLPRLALMSAQADLANAQAQLSNAVATLARQRILIQTGSVAQSQVDTAVAANDTAEARVNQTKAALQKAQEQLGYTDLNADHDGVVTLYSAEVGQVVSTGQTIVTVARPAIRDAVFDVPDDLVGAVKPGAVFAVSLQADASVSASGAVREIAPQADASTRTRRVRLTLTDPLQAFRLGTTVTITLVRPISPRFTLPATAILEQSGKRFVWLFTTGKTAERRAVTLAGPPDAHLGESIAPAHLPSDEVVVIDGLAAGDRVITAGVHSLTDGQTVKLIGD
ncbi:efflux RND transporter periplasmic adaptor subunit [Lichenihabitans psoromatis]|uniref:efflux RND transporter periplasmic adaptor subunit n=1 Tax=Lichenihabitans psoromatis TaxID=2528642 RepID=UPI0010366938|nr:efflux RND transporter periplasmic adaptor subunit [Lichenihabitans psoromatis]